MRLINLISVGHYLERYIIETRSVIIPRVFFEIYKSKLKMSDEFIRMDSAFAITQ